jgi:hypothetical protein
VVVSLPLSIQSKKINKILIAQKIFCRHIVTRSDITEKKIGVIKKQKN